jgi:surfeit locus 1 family protein
LSNWRKLLWPGFATSIALAILVSLGTWQLNRRAEKTAQLAALEAALTATPRALSGDTLRGLRLLPPGSAGDGRVTLGELARVEVRGVFLPTRSVPVRATLPATKGGATSGIGFFWMTPLQVDGGPIVFINRGFVPSGGDWKAPAVPTPEGPQIISGLLRAVEGARTFTPPDDPAKGEYFSRDPAVMARSVGLVPEQVVNLFIDAERTAGSLTPPIGIDPREMIARIPNNHLQYAVTWFAFALTLVGVFGVFARGRMRETDA